MLANHLKPLLLHLLSLKQCGYVEGRQILENIILNQEVIHSFKLPKSLGMLIKLDISKSFDKLSWDYLKATLHVFGFHFDWIKWVISLTSSTYFSILVNGSLA